MNSRARPGATNPKARYDAIVIGAGHNGLVAAGYLAQAGLQVIVLEMSDHIGGLCQTREVLPGLLGNMAANSSHNLDPLIIDDLQLERHGLEWITLQTPSSVTLLPDAGRILAHTDPQLSRAEFDRFALGDAEAYTATLDEMVRLGRSLNVSFYEPPPNFADVRARVSSGREEEFFARVMFGSATEVATERIRSEQVRSSLAMLAVAGNFIGPSTPGSAYPLMQRPLYRGASAAQTMRKLSLTAEYGNRMARGGMGAITTAMAQSARAAGTTILTNTAVANIRCRGDRIEGVVLADGREFDAPIVASAINPKHTLLGLLPPAALEPELRSSLAQVPMDGCMAKIYLALEGEPQFAAARNREENTILARCGFRAGPTIQAMDHSYNRARAGDWSGEPVVYGITQTLLDESLYNGRRHLMSLSVSFAPRTLSNGNTWSQQAGPWMKSVIRWLSQHITNLPDIVCDYGCLSIEMLEQRFGLLGGNALHGDVVVERMFNWRPVAGCSGYATPVPGLYLCSNGTWPANYVSGLPGRNAALRILRDRSANPDLQTLSAPREEQMA